VTIFHLQYILRKRVKLSDRESIFLFCGTHMVKSDTLVSRLYQTRKDPDGFLYLTYSQESVFGATRHIQGL
jgi:GABA(A) receptor-associated protein